MSGPQGERMRVIAVVPDLMDRSKVTARFPGAEIVGSAADLVAAMGRLGDRQRSAALVLVDLGRPGVIDAVRQLPRAAAAGPGLHVVGFASHVDAATLDAAREAGVEALPRSVFFRRLEQGELLGTSALPAPEGVRGLLARTAELAADHLDALGERPVAAAASADELRRLLGGPLPDEPGDAHRTVEDLAAGTAGGLVASNGPRYFGFVTGGALPAALAADWLTSTWDQNVALGVMSPAAAVAEEVVGGWLGDLLGLPPTVSFGLVTGAQMANVVGPRRRPPPRPGPPRRRRGPGRAGRRTAVAGGGRCGAPRHDRRRPPLPRHRHRPADGRRRRRSGSVAPRCAGRGARPPGRGATVVCAQAGCVNSGAFDPFEEIVALAHRAGRWSWVHVDGAFGLWAAASPRLRSLTAGVAGADSWATDGHKWLNVPYDTGFAFVAHPDDHQVSMAMQAAYLRRGEGALRDGSDWAPESSRRARAFPTWAALRSLGRRGVAELIERDCHLAVRLAERLSALPGVEVLNDVVLNQVLVAFGDDARTEAVIAGVQASGVAWFGATTWASRVAARISISGWSTTEADIDRLLAAIAAAAPGPGCLTRSPGPTIGRRGPGPPLRWRGG